MSDSWVCEVCGKPISEDEYRVWSTCEACERKHFDNVDAGNAVAYRCDSTEAAEISRTIGEMTEDDKDRLDRAPYEMPEIDDEVTAMLLQARALLNKAWLANMQAADYEWEQDLGHKINDTYNEVSGLIEKRIYGRKAL